VLVNGQPVASHDLRSGDVIRVGEYELKFVSTYEVPKPPPVPSYAGGVPCPSCGKSMPSGAKICVDCGIDVKTGRPLVVSRGLDEDDLAVRADTWIRILSWIFPFGLFPVASEAFGTRRPVTTWVITIVTTIASTIFLIAVMSADEDDPGVALLNLMQWSGSREVTDRQLDRVRERFAERVTGSKDAKGSKTPPRPMSAEEARELLESLSEDTFVPPEGVGFRWWQPFTCVLLHDPSNPIACVVHLAGNLLFLWVFGMRVNELLGNAKFAIVYPLVALGSTAVDMIVHMDRPLQASVGASGAIMGLAGMYFVFFPAQRVHMAIWFRGGILTGWRCFYKLFAMRGFWLLILWIVWNDVVPMFFELSDGVGHWAHVGGFVTGAALALVLLITRQADARRGDLLSVALGRHAWALLGRPGARVAT
jgi:membrane associated rhomboid family serine protease